MNINDFGQQLKIDAQNEEMAWNNFVKTGRISDYLAYFEYKKIFISSNREAFKNAHSHQGISAEGNKCGRKQ